MGDDGNILLGRVQSEYQWYVGDDANILLGRGQSEYQWGFGGRQ